MVSIAFNCSGDVSTFDRAGFRTRIRTMFPAAEDVRLVVTPASVAIAVQLVMPSVSAASATSTALASETPASLSSVLGVSVLSMSTPAVNQEVVAPLEQGYSYGSYSYDAAPPAAPPPTAARTIIDRVGSSCASSATPIAADDFLSWHSGRMRIVDSSGAALRRFASVNVPNLHRLELPAEACASGSVCARIPTEREVVDALCSVKQMGGEVARMYVLSHGNGAGFHVRNPNGRLSEEWFAALDMVIAVAGELGVRLIIPLVNTAYYPLWGTTAMYAEWLGGTEQPEDFFTSTAQRALFRTVLSRVLLRTNTLTGVAYGLDPSILAWELGNELVDPRHADYPARSARPPNTWTEEMAAHIKLLAPHTLVMDGGFFYQSALTLANVDLLGSTYYNVDADASLGVDLAGKSRFSRTVQKRARGNRVPPLRSMSCLPGPRPPSALAAGLICPALTRACRPPLSDPAWLSIPVMRAYRAPGVGSPKGFLVKEYGFVSENVANRTINGDAQQPPIKPAPP